MNFRESKETMAVSAIFDESGLKRRFYPRDPGEIDISFELLFILGFEIKFFNTVTANDNDAGLLRMGGIYKHFVVGHYCVSSRQPPVPASRAMPAAAV
jgi:hypothetical protein